MDGKECCKVEASPQTKAIIGIDFGTTNSLIAYVVGDGGVQFVESSAKSRLFPSIIAPTKIGFVFGESAKAFPYLGSLKTIIGIEDNLFEKLLEFDGQTHQLRKLVMEMFRALRSSAMDNLKVGSIRAVVTVPAYFGEIARSFIKITALEAGIEVLGLLSEPTAAALAYFLSVDFQAPEDNHYLVFDLGGGTFDVSILKYSENAFQVLEVGGDKNLGGDNFDIALQSALMAKARSRDSEAFPITNVRTFKENYLHEQFQSLDCPTSQFQPLNLPAVHLKAQEFRDAYAPLIQKTIRICAALVHKAAAHRPYLQIKNIILAGGSTRTIGVFEAIQRAFPEAKIFNTINPDEVVGVGAALHAYNLTQKTGYLLIDVVPQNLSLMLAQDICEPLISAGSPIPITARQIFATQIDNQTKIKIAICQGNSHHFSENCSLGEFIFNVAPAPKGVSRIEVSFAVDIDGILTVTCRDLLNNDNFDSLHLGGFSTTLGVNA